MNLIPEKKTLICVWWLSLFLLRHDLTIPLNDNIPYLDDIKLPVPQLILRIDDD